MKTVKQLEADVVRAAMAWYAWAIKSGYIANDCGKYSLREWKACARLSAARKVRK